MSKSARMIKALYKKHRMVKEETYDHEKEDKSVATYGKKPKFDKADKDDSIGEKKPEAAAAFQHIVQSGDTSAALPVAAEKKQEVVATAPAHRVETAKFGLIRNIPHIPLGTSAWRCPLPDSRVPAGG